MSDTPSKRQRMEDEELLATLQKAQSLIARRLAPPHDDTDLARLLLETPVPADWAKNLSHLVFPTQVIQQRVKELAAKISAEYRGQHIVVVGLLNGAVCFLSDLVRQLTVPYVVDFMQVSSYKGTQSKGSVELKKDMAEDPTGRHILIVEDIVDTGTTLAWLRNYLRTKNAASVRVACLLDKKEGRHSANSDILVDYLGFNCPNRFVVVRALRGLRRAA
jgi:hypoxanthine phosphoribosyltransferase